MSKIRNYASGKLSLHEPGACADFLVPGESDTVVITPPHYEELHAEFVTSLIVDETHPYFFDHPCDHVPGMLLLEGCSQLALAAAAATTRPEPGKLAISDYGVSFGQFVEPDFPITLRARVIQGVTNASGVVAGVRISISQQGVIAGTTTLTVASAN
jgi:hypothetical protein